MSNRPYVINFAKIGAPDIGFISVAENGKNLPFKMERMFWTYHTPESVVRGRHAHHDTEMILIAASGRIVVTTESVDGNIEVFVLDNPMQGLYLPKLCWHTMQYSHSSIQIVLASTPFIESDYIRDYNKFEQMRHG